jgi:hypothetical protein
MWGRRMPVLHRPGEGGSARRFPNCRAAASRHANFAIARGEATSTSTPLGALSPFDKLRAFGLSRRRQHKSRWLENDRRDGKTKYASDRYTKNKKRKNSACGSWNAVGSNSRV